MYNIGVQNYFLLLIIQNIISHLHLIIHKNILKAIWGFVAITLRGRIPATAFLREFSSCKKYNLYVSVSFLIILTLYQFCLI